MKVSIGISNRHVHLNEGDLKILFGENYILENLKDLKQPGQYASVATVTIQTEKSSIEKVRVLGPTRPYSQVEISMTDAYKLGLRPPVRESGDITGSEPIKVIGPNGQVELQEGCIIASRHIHITPKQMELYGFKGLEKVDVLIDSNKPGILSDVTLKVADEAYFELHLDTDDANAFLVSNSDLGEIIINECR